MPDRPVFLDSHLKASRQRRRVAPASERGRSPRAADRRNNVCGRGHRESRRRATASPRKLRSGDSDFITSSANGATLSAGARRDVLRYLFKDEDHIAEAVASPELNDAIKQMVSDTVDGAHVLTVMTLGFRNTYAKEQVTRGPSALALGHG